MFFGEAVKRLLDHLCYKYIDIGLVFLKIGLYGPDFDFLCCRNQCENKTLCMEKLSLVLPDNPPYTPRQFSRCAVIGNSGDLLRNKFGEEIDSYDAVFRENGAPIEVCIVCNSLILPKLVFLLLKNFYLCRILQNMLVQKAHFAS